MHSFRRTWALLSLTLSLSGCAAMELAPETEPPEPPTPDTQVKIDGTWWDANRVDPRQLVTERERKLAQESTMATPYSTLPIDQASPEGAPSEGLVFHNVLDAPAPSAESINVPAAEVPIANTLRTTPAEVRPAYPAEPASFQAPAAHEVVVPGRAERAPPLPTSEPAPSAPRAIAAATGGKASPDFPHAPASVARASRPKLKAVGRDSHGKMIAMLQLPGGEMQMAHEGDDLLLTSDAGEVHAYRIQRIGNQQVLLQGDNQPAMVIQ